MTYRNRNGVDCFHTEKSNGVDQQNLGKSGYQTDQVWIDLESNLRAPDLKSECLNLYSLFHLQAIY